MLKRFLIVFAFVAGLVSSAQAEKWRLGAELIHEWSLFHCPDGVPGRFWYFNLEGDQLRVEGPEGDNFTATVTANGSFRANFAATFIKPGTDRVDHWLGEMTGNLKDNWVHMYSITHDCWYRMVPKG
jgi:hypothetical protein